MARSLIVRLVKGNELRKRATLTYVGEIPDAEWIKMRDWLHGKTDAFEPEQVLTVNVVES